MRATVLVTAICFSLASLATAADAEASMKRATDIPPQPLAPALQRLVTESDIQLVYRSELIADLKTNGANGVLTPIETLSQLLSGTGLTYRYLDDKTVTILPLPSGNREAIHPSAERAAGDTSVRAADKDETPPAAKEAQKASFWDRFRLAQADQGKNSSTVDRDAQSSDQSSGNRIALDEIIVTAQKREERLQDVPVPVTAISAAKLVDSNQLRLRDYYTRIPALQVSPQQNNQNLAIRGITTGGLQNPTVGVVVDDMPYGSSTGLGGGQVVPDIDPGDLAQVEVLRGPQGTLYGASSMGGLLKFVTVNPSTDRVSGRVQAGASGIYNGDEAGYDFRGSVNVPLGETLAVRASGFTHQDPGYIDNPVRDINAVNQERVSGGRLSALWQPSESLALKVSALYQDTRREGSYYVHLRPGLGDLEQNYRPGTGWANKKAQAYAATLTANLGAADLTAISGYNVNSHSDSFDYTWAVGPLTATSTPFGVSDATLFSWNDAKKFTQEVRLSAPVGQKFEWVLGAFYTHERSRSEQHITADSPSGAAVGDSLVLIFPPKFTEYAAFGDVTYYFTDRFDVQVGGRESRLRQSIEQTASGPFTPIFYGGRPSPAIFPLARSKADAFTYLVTPRFKVTPDLMVYARVASGYRAGGPNLGGGASGTPLQFRPDKTQNYEIGIKGNFLDHRLSFDASLYYIDWTDIQLQATNPTTRLSYNFNGSEARSQGAELSVETRPLERLTIAAWAAWNDAALTQALPPGASFGVSGDRLPYSSRFSGNISVDQEFPLANTWTGFVGGSVSYVGNRIGLFRAPSSTGVRLPRQSYPAYTKADLRAGVRNDSWTADIYVNNVADKRGLLNGGLGYSPAYAFVYVQPRTIGFSLTKTF